MSMRGTPEKAWSAPLGRLCVVEPETLFAEAQRLVVVSPHPDDETLATAGILIEALARNLAVHVVSVTDGEASHAGSASWVLEELRSARAAELDNAMSVIGVPPNAITRLHVPDGEVASHSDALLDHLLRLLEPSDLVISPWHKDGHPDHEAATQSVMVAERMRRFRRLETPIWMWHWQAPDSKAIPWRQLKRVPLSRCARRLKTQALSSFKSQLGVDPSLESTPIVNGSMLAHFRRPFESFFDHAA